MQAVRTARSFSASARSIAGRFARTGSARLALLHAASCLVVCAAFHASSLTAAAEEDPNQVPAYSLIINDIQATYLDESTMVITGSIFDSENTPEQVTVIFDGVLDGFTASVDSEGRFAMFVDAPPTGFASAKLVSSYATSIGPTQFFVAGS